MEKIYNFSRNDGYMIRSEAPVPHDIIRAGKEAFPIGTDPTNLGVP